MLSRFQAGYVPPSTKPLGTTRVKRTRDQVHLEVKFAEAKGRRSGRWRTVHRVVWEAEHGPTPPGFVVVFRPGMHTLVLEEITLDRLELITRAELLGRNSILRYPPELQAAMKLRGRLVRRIAERARTTESESA